MNKSLIEEADTYLENQDFQKAYNLLLPYKNSEDEEVLWRLAQAMHDIAYYHPTSESKKYFAEALHLTEKALKINEKNPEVHKMMAAVIDSYYKNVSVKARVEQTMNVKKHMLRAAELQPNDPHPYYLLGSWHYSVADISWAIKKITKTIFSTPLEATFEEALGYFQKQMEVGSKAYKNHITGYLMIGKCLLKLNRKKEAIENFNKVLDLPEKTPREKEAHAEARKIMKDL